MSDKWIHLATTFDVETSVVTHYVDGQAIYEDRIPDSLMVKKTRIGEATLGNWSLPTRTDSRFAIRNLNGTMDELLILKTALKPVDIAEICRIAREAREAEDGDLFGALIGIENCDPVRGLKIGHQALAKSGIVVRSDRT